MVHKDTTYRCDSEYTIGIIFEEVFKKIRAYGEGRCSGGAQGRVARRGRATGSPVVDTTGDP